ncbi:CPBP family intramembrane glutamic endopeptidase [Clostridium lundense]|uniref:CPBP family intramembrane glutamic endopeptidase n=1 Tax=Clostridium lundense TaxID=319475 RepID=UPI000483B414|nr:CPBP family intramembrane glutamic endopeptidase [Clostridium lundense]
MSAILISGILFGIIHSIQPSIISESNILIMIKDMFNQVGGGLVSGFIFILYLEKSGSIFVPILIHALLDYSYNILGLLVAGVVLGYLFIANRNNEEKLKVTDKL